MLEQMNKCIPLTYIHTFTTVKVVVFFFFFGIKLFFFLLFFQLVVMSFFRVVALSLNCIGGSDAATLISTTPK